MKVLPDLADYAVGATVTLTCLKAIRYTLFGDKEVSCLSGGDWSDSPYCMKTGQLFILYGMNNFELSEHQIYAYNRTLGIIQLNSMSSIVFIQIISLKARKAN